MWRGGDLIDLSGMKKYIAFSGGTCIIWILDDWTIFLITWTSKKNLDVHVFTFLKTWTSSFSKQRKPRRPFFKSRVLLFTSRVCNFFETCLETLQNRIERVFSSVIRMFYFRHSLSGWLSVFLFHLQQQLEWGGRVLPRVYCK